MSRRHIRRASYYTVKSLFGGSEGTKKRSFTTGDWQPVLLASPLSTAHGLVSALYEQFT